MICDQLRFTLYVLVIPIIFSSTTTNNNTWNAINSNLYSNFNNKLNKMSNYAENKLEKEISSSFGKIYEHNGASIHNQLRTIESNKKTNSRFHSNGRNRNINHYRDHSWKIPIETSKTSHISSIIGSNGNGNGIQKNFHSNANTSDILADKFDKGLDEDRIDKLINVFVSYFNQHHQKYNHPESHYNNVVQSERKNSLHSLDPMDLKFNGNNNNNNNDHDDSHFDAIQGHLMKNQKNYLNSESILPNKNSRILSHQQLVHEPMRNLNDVDSNFHSSFYPFSSSLGIALRDDDKIINENQVPWLKRNWAGKFKNYDYPSSIELKAPTNDGKIDMSSSISKQSNANYLKENSKTNYDNQYFQRNERTPIKRSDLAVASTSSIPLPSSMPMPMPVIDPKLLLNISSLYPNVMTTSFLKDTINTPGDSNDLLNSIKHSDNNLMVNNDGLNEATEKIRQIQARAMQANFGNEMMQSNAKGNQVQSNQQNLGSNSTCSQTETNSMSNLLAQLLFELKKIKQIQNGTEISPEGSPCNIIGSWNSQLIGLRFDISLAEHDSKAINVDLQEMYPAKRHSHLDCEWSCYGSALSMLGGPLYIIAEKENEKTLATFSGLCKTCSSIDTIFGIWTFTNPAKDCQDMQLSIETKHDVLHRYNLPKKKKIRLQDIKSKGKKCARKPK